MSPVSNSIHLCHTLHSAYMAYVSIQQIPLYSKCLRHMSRCKEHKTNLTLITTLNVRLLKIATVSKQNEHQRYVHIGVFMKCSKLVLHAAITASQFHSNDNICSSTVMGVDHGGTGGTRPPPRIWSRGDDNANCPPQYKNERSVAFRKCQNPFLAGVPPRTPLGELTMLPQTP